MWSSESWLGPPEYWPSIAKPSVHQASKYLSTITGIFLLSCRAFTGASSYFFRLSMWPSSLTADYKALQVESRCTCEVNCVKDYALLHTSGRCCGTWMANTNNLEVQETALSKLLYKGWSRCSACNRTRQTRYHRRWETQLCRCVQNLPKCFGLFHASI